MPLVGFRANPEKHKRILDWLKPFSESKGRSDEARRLIELGIDVEEGKYIKRENTNVKTDVARSHLPWLNSNVKNRT